MFGNGVGTGMGTIWLNPSWIQREFLMGSTKLAGVGVGAEELGVPVCRVVTVMNLLFATATLDLGWCALYLREHVDSQRR